MYAKHSFERLWEWDRKDQLFICTNFDETLEDRFRVIEEAAKSLGLKATYSGIETGANDLHDKILYEIANSKILLFDLTREEDSKKLNPNVMYELGVATAIREPSDIIILMSKRFDLPFNIKNLKINYEEEINVEFIKNIIKKSLEDQKWYRDKKVEIAATSMDDLSLELMLKLNSTHFNSKDLDTNRRLALHKLIDLGCVWFNTGKERDPTEYAYWWTPFGKEVMKYLSIGPK